MLGDEAANEMVDWMRRVDAQRAELRDLNELNFARIEALFHAVDARFREIDARFGQVDTRFGELKNQMAVLEADFRKDMEVGFARLEKNIDRRFAEVMKWPFVFWVGSALTLAGTFAAMTRFLP
jgi:hypothetical protein